MNNKEHRSTGSRNVTNINTKPQKAGNINFKRVLLLLVFLFIAAGAAIAIFALDNDHYNDTNSEVRSYIGVAPVWHGADDISWDREDIAAHLVTDTEGNISVYSHIGHYGISRTIYEDRVYIHVHLPVELDAEEIMVTMPYGWTHEINQVVEYKVHDYEIAEYDTHYHLAEEYEVHYYATDEYNALYHAAEEYQAHYHETDEYSTPYHEAEVYDTHYHAEEYEAHYHTPEEYDTPYHVADEYYHTYYHEAETYYHNHAAEEYDTFDNRYEDYEYALVETDGVTHTVVSFGYIGIMPLSIPIGVDLPSGITIRDVTQGNGAATTVGTLAWGMAATAPSPRGVRLMNDITRTEGVITTAAGTTHIFSDTADAGDAFRITRTDGTARHFNVTTTLHIWNATIDRPPGPLMTCPHTGVVHITPGGPSSSGGGIEITAAAGRLHLENGSTISHNRTSGAATSRGGGIRVATGQMTMRDGAAISFNASNVVAATPSGGGGGIHFQSSSGADNSVGRMYGGLIYRNHSSTVGGGVQLTASGQTGSARFHMYGGAVKYNISNTSGGGLQTNSDGSFVLDGVLVIHGNRALGTAGTQGGGGIRLYGTDTTINLNPGSQITNNHANNHGGGISLRVASQGIRAVGTPENPVIFDGNTSNGPGGAIHANAALNNANSGTLATRRAIVLNHATFRNNRATDGGAIYMQSGNLPSGSAATTLAIGQNVIFEDNLATNGMRVDENLEWRNRGVVHPGLASGVGGFQSASLTWIGVNPNPGAGTVQSPVVAWRQHVFNNYDVRVVQWNYLRRVKYEIIGGAAAASSMHARLTHLARPTGVTVGATVFDIPNTSEFYELDYGTLVIAGTVRDGTSLTRVRFDVTDFPDGSVSQDNYARVVNWNAGNPAGNPRRSPTIANTAGLVSFQSIDATPAAPAGRPITSPPGPLEANNWVPLSFLAQPRIEFYHRVTFILEPGVTTPPGPGTIIGNRVRDGYAIGTTNTIPATTAILGWQFDGWQYAPKNPPPTDACWTDINLTADTIITGPVYFIAHFSPVSDWIRLNRAINDPTLNPRPTDIIIHPTGGAFVTDTQVGTTFNLVIRDPNPLPVGPGGAGHTITTIPIPGAPSTDPHRILVDRDITITAVAGTDITLRMPVTGGIGINTPTQAPWGTPAPPINLHRHFVVEGAAAHLRLGAVGSGDLRVDGNAAINNTGHRGGIRVESGNFTMQVGSQIFNCRAVNGGGVHVTGGIFTMTGGIIGHETDDTQANNASRGGGVWVGYGATFNMNQGGVAPNFTNGRIVRNLGSAAGVHDVGEAINSAFNSGGGVYLAGDTTTFTLNHGDIALNRGDGGGGVAISGGTFSMAGGTISENLGNAGGGVRVRGGTFNMTDGAISDHTTRIGGILPPQEGGGVQIDLGTFNMHGGTIEGNHSRHGGGIHARFHTSAFVMHDGTIRNNEDVLLGGGGVRVVVGASFDMHGGYITGNTATTNGGGVVVSGRSAPANGNQVSAFTMTGGTIGGSRGCLDNCLVHVNPLDCDPDLGNTAVNGGGGVWVGSQASFIMNQGGGGANPVTRGTITGNTAQNGGGVHVSAAATALITDGIISRNRAISVGAPGGGNQTGTGGGVFLTGSGTTFTMNGGQIYENIANTITQGRGGGGVEAVASAVFTLNQTNNAIPTEIFHNYALNSGGGVNIHSTTMHMHGGRISRNGTDNTADYGNGGGVAVNGSSTMHMHGGIIENNVGRIGGGLFLYTSTAYMHPDAIIRDNASTHPGGGVAVYSGFAGVTNAAHFRMYGGLIHNNGVQNHPIESICAQGLPMPNPAGVGTLNNTPRGGGVATGRHLGTFEMRGGTISNNQATYGGGIALILGSNATINPMGGGAPLIYNNTATNDGGGVHISGIENRAAVAAADHIASFFTMNGGTIDNNTATRNGGGIFIANDTVTVTVGGSPTIRRNQATLNAGVSITDNTANATGSGIINGGGGGVYITENGRLTATSTTITGNEAPNGMGGGIFTEDHGNYPNPLTINPAPGNNTAIHFRNITLNAVQFSGNSADFLAIPPANVLPPNNPLAVLPNIDFNTTTPALPNAGYHHPLNNFDINFNIVPVLFQFYKTDIAGARLPGAQFRLFRTSATTGLDDYLITSASYTGVNPLWVERPMEEATSLPVSGLVSFYMTPGYTYQLVEVVAPSGFMIPMGQWRIVVDFAANPGHAVGMFTTTTIGLQSTPGLAFINSGCNVITCDNTGALSCNELCRWELRNLPNFELPMSGGGGTMFMVMTGSIILFMAALAAGVLVAKKKMPIKAHVLAPSKRYSRTLR